MNITIFLKGLFTGFFVAIPTGPMGIICIRRTLSQGFIYGIVSGLGIATADLIYGVTTIFGLAFVSNFLAQYRIWFKLAIGIFLIILGIKILLQKNLVPSDTQIKKTNLISDYTSSLFLTLTNPFTILIFASFFSLPMINIDINELTYASSFFLVTGIFLGSALWFFILSLLVSSLRSKFSSKYFKSVNKLSGILIIIIGIIALIIR